jgi:glycosyltransferase involved in cell wall biosynthesis
VKRVCVGVHVHAEPERLSATLASLRVNTVHPVELLLLPDGPDAATRALLAGLVDLPQDGTDDPLGPPACFNRLAAGSDAEILVLLESGALVAPGWLERLLAALDADPRHGLAGPSTNRSWNEQGAFPRAGGTLYELGATARLALERFGSGEAWRTLEPLHSLADFCYLVRREVVDAIGAADESYRLGPCWEMDYNARAARAGYLGVWACQSYVFRSPFTERRRRSEAAGFEASKRRYQDRFCGLRLGAHADPGRPYEAHCRGEACQHFAPADLVRIALPPPRRTSIAPAAPATDPACQADCATGHADAGPARAAAATAVAVGEPLISCIMPTRGRPDFALRAIAYFLAQEYPNRELIVVDDEGSDLASRLPTAAEAAGPTIKYAQVPAGTRIGAKRNRACEMAAGAIIAHWDDDDWYSPRRLSEQAAPLLSDQAEIVGLEAGIFFELERWRFWRCTPELHRRLFVGDVHGGTLMFRRHVWERLARYPDVSLAEDAAFLRQATQRGARLRKLPNAELFVYLRHGRNAWTFTPGEFLDPRGWLPVPEPRLPAADRAFYAARTARPTAPPEPPGAAASTALPLVSCIMPTHNRRGYVAQAIRYFLRQDYPNRELLILDDGDDRVADLVPDDQPIRYTGLPRRMVLGAKRNLACEMARGEIIAHWDDDDWIAPGRLSRQVGVLQSSRADLCGATRQLYYEPTSDRAWMYEYPSAHRRWMAGNTLCYRKSFWETNRFPEIQVGEDTRFVWSPRASNTALMPDYDFYVGLVHDTNTSPKSLSGPLWHPHPVADVHRLLGDDLRFYARSGRAEERQAAPSGAER